MAYGKENFNVLVFLAVFSASLVLPVTVGIIIYLCLCSHRIGNRVRTYIEGLRNIGGAERAVRELENEPPIEGDMRPSP